MKKHGHHGKRKRFGAQQQARVFARPRPMGNRVDEYESKRQAQLRRYVAIFGKERARNLVIEIYGEEYASRLEFLQ